MRALELLLGALLGVATALPLLALYAFGASVVGLPQVPFDVFASLAAALPGALVTLFIDSLVAAIAALNLGPTDETAKLIQQMLALGFGCLVGALLGGSLAWAAGRGLPYAPRLGLATGCVLGLAAVVVELGRGLAGGLPALTLWLILPPALWGAILGRLVAQVVSPAGPTAPAAGTRLSRRDLLVRVAAGSVGIALALWGVGSLPGRKQQASGADQPLPASLASLPTPPAGRPDPAPGARPEVTPTPEFYRVDITLNPPAIDGETWRLEVVGLFARPRALSLTDLMAYPAVTEARTLGCISNPVGGDLIGTAYWTGLRLRDLLEDLGLLPEAVELHVRAVDGFYETVLREDMLDPRTLLVYGMNGRTLTVEHGFPLRILIPDRYGMKQPKWITRIEASDRRRLGYWVERGWSEEALVQITSQFDRVPAGKAGETVPIGGIAWSGAQGIQKVEIQIDGGPWQEATLRAPALSPLTWLQWRFDWLRQPGTHILRVRATDGRGNRQIEQQSGPHPEGATGYHVISLYDR